MRRFLTDSRVGLDLQDLATSLPAVTCMDPATGRALYLPAPRALYLPAPSPSPSPSPNSSPSPSAAKAAAAAGDQEDEEDEEDVHRGWWRRWLRGLLGFRDDAAAGGASAEQQQEEDEELLRLLAGRGGVGEGAQLTPDGGVVPARLVLGAARDFNVDRQGLREAAAYLGIAQGPVVLPGLYHDVMLGPRWRAAAFALQRWLEDTVSSR